MKNEMMNRGRNKSVGDAKVTSRANRPDPKGSGGDRLQLLTIWQINPLTLQRELQTVLVPRSFCISKRMKVH